MRRGRRPHPELLTPREQEVLACLREGLSNAEIASRLAISLDGVKYHVSEILAKLEVDSRQEAAAWRGDPTAPRFGAGALRGLTGLLGRVSIAKASAVAVLGAAGIGLALLAFGVFSMDRREAELGKIAYIYEGDVWVKELPDGEAKRLTTGGRKSSPEWSGDGEWLTYRDGIAAFVIRGDGSDSRRLAGPYESVEFLSWSPKDATLSYVTSEGLVVEKPDQGERLVLPSGEGSDHWTLSSWPTWSPDGKQIAFIRDEREGLVTPEGPWKKTNYGLWVIRPDLTHAKEVYRHEVMDEGGPQARQQLLVPVGWNDRSSVIYFVPMVPFGPEGTEQLHSVSATGGTPRALGVSVFAKQDGLLGALQFADYFDVSQTGRVAVVTGEGYKTWTNKTIVTLHRNGGSANTVTTDDVVGISPSWSPDGLLAFVVQPDVGRVVEYNDFTSVFSLLEDRGDTGRDNRRIWISRPGGSHQQRLTEGDSPEERPQWSSDGRHILYVSTTPGRSLLAPATLQLFSWAGRTSTALATIDTYIYIPENSIDGPDEIPIDFLGHREWDMVFDWWQPPLN